METALISLEHRESRLQRAVTSLSVVVPVYNEEYLVAASLRRLRVFENCSILDRVQIIVVDDCSTDQTAKVLEKFQRDVRNDLHESKIEWKFLRHEANQGKGGALRSAIEHADCELTVVHDADLEYHPRDLLNIIPLFFEEEADAVYGSRFLAGAFKRALFYRHSLGNRWLTCLCNLASDLDLSDMETCYKMVQTDLLKSIPLESRDFRIEPELTIKLAKRGARVFEVPISYSGRTYQEGKKIGWKDGVLALIAIIKFAISDNICKEDQYGSEILARLRRAPRFTKWMADTIRPYIGDRVLEIGAGIGNLTLNLIPRKLYFASDINPLYLRELKKLESTRPYLRTGHLDLVAGETYPREQKFDTVICLNVLEHVKADHIALANIRDVLRNGGTAIVLVPQGAGLFGTLDRVLGHHRRYAKSEFGALAKSAGFEVKQIFEFNRAGSPAWWLNGRVLRRSTFGLVQIKILNALTPLFRKTDSWLPLPALSLIGIFEKPADQVLSRKEVQARTSVQDELMLEN